MKHLVRQAMCLFSKKAPSGGWGSIYPPNLVAHTIGRNIPRCTTEAHLNATERFIQTHLAARYPAKTVNKYIRRLKWELLFKRIELGNPLTINPLIP